MSPVWPPEKNKILHSTDSTELFISCSLWWIGWSPSKLMVIFADVQAPILIWASWTMQAMCIWLYMKMYFNFGILWTWFNIEKMKYEDVPQTRNVRFFSPLISMNGSQEVGDFFLISGVPCGWGWGRTSRHALCKRCGRKTGSGRGSLPAIQENTDGSVSIMQPDWWISIDFENKCHRD